MYQIFSHIGSTSSGTLPHPGTEGVKTTQLSDIFYFVLIYPKRFSGGNSMSSGGVYEVCGTRVVHVWYIFQRMWYTFSNVPHHGTKTMYHP